VKTSVPPIADDQSNAPAEPKTWTPGTPAAPVPPSKATATKIFPSGATDRSESRSLVFGPGCATSTGGVL
jgi:hypothetical protein